MTTHPIPDVALDGRIGIVGITGSGKSTTAKGGVERLLELERRTCVVDLLDGWWGLRLKRNGKTPAFPVVIFGGRHGDLPLNEHAGAVIGQAVAQSQESAVVSLAELDSDAARRRFAQAFFDALHRHNRAPLHLIIDEADFYAPQVVMKSDGPAALLLNRVKEIAARGRMRGFRCWWITQRPAKLNKDVLSQADTLIAMQLTASQDRNAIKAWIGDQADAKEGDAILATLPRMKRGQGVLWSPRLGILAPTDFPLPHTYDSSRTPEYGEQVADVDLAPLDLPALRDRMAKVTEEAKANDPRILKAEVARLTRELTKKPVQEFPEAGVEAVNRAYAEGDLNGYRRGIDAASTAWRGVISDFAIAAGTLNRERIEVHNAMKGEDLAFAGIEALVDKYHIERADPPTLLAITPMPTPKYARPHAPEPVVGVRKSMTVAEVRKAYPDPAPRVAHDGINGPQQRILDALAWWESVGIVQPSRVQVAVIAHYSPNGGAFQNPLGGLRTMGAIEYPTGGTVTLTEQGRALATPPDAPATVEDFHARLQGILNGPQWRILAPAIAAYPDSISRADVAAAAGYAPDGGAFQNPLGSLRSLGLIDYPRAGFVVAQPILFLER